MKRLIATTVALTMLGSTAAMAHDYRGYRHHKHHDNLGPVLAVGLGVAALAIIASSQSDHDRYQRRGYYRAANGYYYRNRANYYGYRGYDRHHGWYRGYYRHHDHDRGYYREYDDD